MRIPVTEAKDQRAELARRAEAGDEVVLTQVGGRDIRLVPEQRSTGKKYTKEERHRLIREIQKKAAKKGLPETDAARSQDFLYDEYGLPK